MAKRKQRTGTLASGALGVVRQAREAAKAALGKLRQEIAATRALLENLLEEERIFKSDVFGDARGAGRTRTAAATRGAPAKRKRRKRRAPKRPPRAEKFFEKLPSTFTLEDVRKLAGRGAGISLAQWSRAKRIKKSGDKYQKLS